MSRVQRKIEDRSGASLSVALLFFLLCAIVGSILIAAASASMGRMKNIEQGEQDRYAVDSAMNLIAEKMGKGAVTFNASMKPVVVQVVTDGGDDGEEISEEGEEDNDEDDNGYNEHALDNLEDWELSVKDDSAASDVRDFSMFRKEIVKRIFTHYLNVRSSDRLSGANNENNHHEAEILDIWYPSQNDFTELYDALLHAGVEETNIDDLEEFFYGTPGTTWASIPKNDFKYISTIGDDTTLKEDPFIFSFKSTAGDAEDKAKKDELAVNVLFCMDEQFNITAVIYPHKQNNGSDKESLKDAGIYRVVMIPCTEATIHFDPGITENIEEDGDKTTTTTSVQHLATLTVKWGNPIKDDTTVIKPVKTSVIPKAGDTTGNYPDFFPDEFRKLAY